MADSEPVCQPAYPAHAIAVDEGDVNLLQFAENLEHLEADYFLWGALGYGLDEVAPQLVMGGPPPIGAKKAKLDNLTLNIITEFAYEEVAHLRFFFICIPILFNKILFLVCGCSFMRLCLI